MELAFHTKSVRGTCENEDQAKVELGVEVAEALKHRLADMRAARSPKDLVAGRPRIVADGQEMAIDVCEGYRIIFKANHLDCPSNDMGGVDWAKVSRIKIMRIESEDESRPRI